MGPASIDPPPRRKPTSRRPVIVAMLVAALIPVCLVAVVLKPEPIFDLDGDAVGSSLKDSLEQPIGRTDCGERQKGFWTCLVETGIGSGFGGERVLLAMDDGRCWEAIWIPTRRRSDLDWHRRRLETRPRYQGCIGFLDYIS